MNTVPPVRPAPPASPMPARQELRHAANGGGRMNAAPPRATQEGVKQANRRLYDTVAHDYEAIDGRRDDALISWIRARLRALAEIHGRALLIDIGSGSGVVTRVSTDIFDRSVAIDLSPKILAAAGNIADMRLAGDTDALPIADDSADVISCFAVLHHLYGTDVLAREVARVLKPGGVFWSDHDMDLAFYRRFRLPLAAYRRLRGSGRHYREAGVDSDTYSLAEFHEDGVDGGCVLRHMTDAGLDASATFHWFGLTGLTNRLFGRCQSPRGWAPLLRIVAIKPRAG